MRFVQRGGERRGLRRQENAETNQKKQQQIAAEGECTLLIQSYYGDIIENNIIVRGPVKQRPGGMELARPGVNRDWCRERKRLINVNVHGYY